MSFAKNVSTNLSNKYSQKLLNSGKKSKIDAIKTASKKVIQKTAEANGDLNGKIADKIAIVSKSTKELHSHELYLKANVNET